MKTTCPTCQQVYVALRCTWCRREQLEVLELIRMLRTNRERRRGEHERLIARTAYRLGRRMAAYEVTRAQAEARIEALALATWDDICVPQHITSDGEAIGAAALALGLERGQRGRAA